MASCCATFDHLQNDADVVMLGASDIGTVGAPPAGLREQVRVDDPQRPLAAAPRDRLLHLRASFCCFACVGEQTCSYFATSVAMHAVR